MLFLVCDAALDAPHQGGQPHGHQERGLRLHRELEQDLALQRLLLQSLAEGAALGGVAAGQHQAAPDGRRRSDCVMQARDVEHRRHLGEATLEVAHQLGVRALQRDLAGGHGAGAQLVLQAIDPVAVAGAVRQDPRDQEEAQPASSRLAALRPGQRQHHLAAHVAAEVLASVEAPVAVLAPRLDQVGADVRATLLLGHPLACRPGLLGVAADQVRQHLLAQRLRPEVPQHPGGGVRHRDRAHVGRGAWLEEVAQGRVHDPQLGSCQLQ